VDYHWISLPLEIFTLGKKFFLFMDGGGGKIGSLMLQCFYL